jgi:mRNA-degrading endonuclease RelE of RelBE toxin-antitoxin system
MSDVKNIKKLKGSENSYRITISDYRIGVVLIKEKCVFTAFDHRSGISHKASTLNPANRTLCASQCS